MCLKNPFDTIQNITIKRNSSIKSINVTDLIKSQHTTNTNITKS